MSIPALIVMNQLNGANRYPYAGGGGGNSFDEPDAFLNFMFGVVIVMLLCVVGFFVFAIMQVREEERLDKLPKTVYSMPKGEVVKLNRCYSGKHHFTCNVTFSDGKSFFTDITEWPDEVLTPGNTLHWEIHTQGDRQKQYLCDVKKCNHMGTYRRGKEGFSEVFARGNK